MIGALLVACALSASAADVGVKAAPPVPGVGVVVLGQGGDRDWSAQLDLIKKELGKTPVSFAGGDADAKAIQQAVSLLETNVKVKKIVVVPLYVSSFSDELDEDRYILGIREKPAAAIVGAAHAHFGAPRRVQTKLPIVMTKALDDHPLFVEMLAARAMKQSRDPGKEALLLVGSAPVSTTTTREWLDDVAALAEKVRQKGGFAASRAAAIADQYGPERRERAQQELRKLVTELRRQGRVIAVSLELSEPFGHSRVSAALDGLFVRADARGLFPDQKVADWVGAMAQDGAKLPDMKNYHDAAGFGANKGASFPPLGGY